MQASERRNKTPLKPGRVAGLMLLALFWVQLGVAVHQLDHVTDDLGEYCEVCVQFDRAGDAPAPATAAAAPATDAPVPAVAIPGAVPRAPVRGYRSRAPPPV